MAGQTKQDQGLVLAINSGSSSVKASLYSFVPEEQLVQTIVLERIGLPDGELLVQDDHGSQIHEEQLELPDHEAAFERLFSWLEREAPAGQLQALGHRVVHGGQDFDSPHRIDEHLLRVLKELIPLAPDHLPNEISGIEATTGKYPHLLQAACFDTAFHRRMPRVAQIYALPRWAWEAGIRRYGFHGLSYEFILQELHKRVGESAAAGRVVIAHLGNGASMAAVRSGRCVDTTMGYTPAGGLVMGTRPGDLDPGAVLALMRRPGAEPSTLNTLINKQSGLLGLSGSTPDMQDLLQRKADDQHAAEAVEVFCYQARKYLGAMIAALGGLDTLVFTAGIGENAVYVRARICEAMEFAGISLDPERNQKNAAIISPPESPVTVRVMHTDEDLMIARHTFDLLRTS
ncbi:MAG: acetate/propionate family kinase [Anaerolineales bacterium]